MLDEFIQMLGARRKTSGNSLTFFPPSKTRTTRLSPVSWHFRFHFISEWDSSCGEQQFSL